MSLLRRALSLGLATTPPTQQPVQLSRGSGGGPGATHQGQPSNPDAKGGTPNRTGNHTRGLPDTQDEDNTVPKMLRIQHAARIRFGKVMP